MFSELAAFLLLVCAVDVLSLDGGADSKDVNIEESSDWHDTSTYKEENKYLVDNLNTKEIIDADNSVCQQRSKLEENSNVHNEKSSAGFDCENVDKENDHSKHLSEEQERKSYIDEDADTCSKESREQSLESKQEMDTMHSEELVSEEQEEEECDNLREDSKCDTTEEGEKKKDLRDQPEEGENARESMKEELDPELENVPLREILLKLKVSQTVLSICHWYNTLYS